MAEQGPSFYRLSNLYNFEVNKQFHPPTPNLHRQEINACYIERTKTKKEAGKVLLSKILNVNCAPLNFMYNWKIRNKHRCALAIAGKTVFGNLQRCGAFIADFPSEK
jgi:hypothetical protein